MPAPSIWGWKVQSAWSPMTSHDYLQADGWKKNLAPWIPQYLIFEPYGSTLKSISFQSLIHTLMTTPASRRRKKACARTSKDQNEDVPLLSRSFTAWIYRGSQKYTQNVSRMLSTVIDDLFPSNFHVSNVSIYLVVAVIVQNVHQNVCSEPIRISVRFRNHVIFTMSRDRQMDFGTRCTSWIS